MAKVVPKNKTDENSDEENNEPQTFTQEQLDEATEAARAEIRSEFETQISDLTEEIQELKDTLAEARKKKAKGGEGDLSEAITQAVESARKEWEKAHKKDLNKLQEQVNALSEENKSKKVQEWKAQAIEAYDGQVIPALIKGNTEEEILESAESSHETWLETMRAADVEIVEEEESSHMNGSEEDNEGTEEDGDEEDEDEEDGDEEEVPLTKHHSKAFSEKAGVQSARIKKKKSQPVTIKSQARAIIVPNPGIERGGVRRNEPDAKLRGVRGLSMSEYRKRRESILATARARYGGVRS